MTKVFMGARLRRLREERGLTQAALAAKLQISPSYMNQLEHNQRPLTVPILLRATAALEVDAQYFSDEDEARLLAELRDVLAMLPSEQAPSTSDLRALASDLPAVVPAMVLLYRRYREAVDRAEALASRISDGDRASLAAVVPMPYEEVRDFFYAHHNYLPALEDASERLGSEASLVPGDMSEGLARRLEEKHGVRVVTDDENADDATPTLRCYDAKTRSLHLPRYLQPGQRAFQMATQLAFLELGDLLRDLAHGAQLSSHEARALARIGLASYFAGALLCPYERFLERAEALNYDIDRLSTAFGVGFQPICHRLSTLQRPDARGVPFFFVRVDRAGNISKRQSATDFHFSRVGGTCPLWNVYEAFAQPGRVLTQLAQMPDGRTYLWIARTVSSRRGAYRAPVKEFAVGLGCDVRHAPKLVYSEGLGQALTIDENMTRFAPYPVA